MRLAELADRRVAIWGLGREGRAALAALQRRFPHKPLTLICSEQEAAALRTELVAQAEPSPPAPLPAAEESAALSFVTDPVDATLLSQFDVVIKSPGISPYRSPVPDAERAGVRFTSGTAIWFAERPDARVVAVTGTKGKSTTSAMIAHMARALGLRTALAGNIGLPLLELLGAQADLWVVELSSFQTGTAGPLAVGVLTNLSEEHLDWHGDYARYAADKLKLADAAHTLVVNATQPELMARTASHPQRVLYGDADGWHIESGALYRGREAMDASPHAIGVPGAHNALNACAALSALQTLGELDGEHVQRAVRSLAGFRGLPHRLQPLDTHDGLRWIDDSISTTPEATLAALRSLADQPVTVILGGHDRGLDWAPFAVTVAAWRGLRVIAQGGNAARIAQALRNANFAGSLERADSLAAAVERARVVTAQGGSVLLSPGAPSFDQFRDYAERGRAFARLAGADSVIGEIEGMGVV